MQDRFGKICCTDNANRVTGTEQAHDVAEILGVRADNDRYPMLRGLKNVVAAGRHKAASDDGEISQSVQVGKLAD